MTKYLVSGYIGFDNFGDEAIAKTLVQKLKKEDSNSEITLISSNPDKTTQNYDVKSCGMFKFFKPLRNCDVLISGGGSLLQDVTSFKSLMYYLGIIYLGLFLRKKVKIFAQGIGPINSKIGQILTKMALKHCTEISVRDEKSQQLLKAWGINSTLVNDPILDIDLPHKNKTGTVGIQLRSFPSLKEKFLDKLAEEIVNKFSNKKIQVISLQDSIDKEICQNFINKLKKINQNLQIELLTNLSVNEVFEIISDLEYLVAMRFHANVVGLKSGIKTMAINYDIKVEKLAREYNLPILELDLSNFDNTFANFK